ncbi:MAG: hypothetical protein NZ561_11905 [Phycisphaerae bacterium]|nr:hypothetical protein [Phycisphaerae bacterium]MDW8261636.1 hypothetical protein [Phycisphaerales bacterium]
MTHSSSQRLHDWLHDKRHRTFSRAQKLLLLFGTVIAFWTAWVSQRLFNPRPVTGFSASILQQPSAVRSVIAVSAAAFAACILTMLLGRKVRPDAGLFCAAVGLLYFRFQGSATRHALFHAGSAEGYLWLALELALLGIVLFLAFLLLNHLVSIGVLADDAAADGATVEVEKLDQKLLCTATVAVVTTAGMMIFCQTDRPGQTIWSVFLAAFLATWCAFRFIPVVPSAWYWTGPILAGAIGYLYTWKFGAQNAAIGEPAGMFAALARPMPLDYASVGVAGSLMGYWIARRQHRERQEEADAAAAAGTHEAAG